MSASYNGVDLGEAEIDGGKGPRYYWLKPDTDMTADERRFLIALAGKQGMDVKDQAGNLLRRYDKNGEPEPLP